MYSYIKYVSEGKSWDSDKATIIGLGSYVETHERHYAQQCEYTICKKRDGDHFIYASHDEGLENRMSVQGLLVKYVIPIDQRRYFLRELESNSASSAQPRDLPILRLR